YVDNRRTCQVWRVDALHLPHQHPRHVRDRVVRPRFQLHAHCLASGRNAVASGTSVKCMNADLLCGLLAEPSRLRTYSAVVLGASTPEQVAGSTGLAAPVVVKALQRLT